MKDYLKIFTNWRIYVLTALFGVAVLLIMCECEDATLLVATKIIGLVIGFGCFALAKWWGRKGKIDELKVFNDE